MNNKYLIAGFGGQGILFAGKLLATIGLISEKEVTWMPSYGPEMRGGTCNCSVCISNRMIGSPVVSAPDVLIVMNTPSYDMFIDKVAPSGMAFIDSTLIDCGNVKNENSFCVDATRLAADNDLKGMANIIILGKMFKEVGGFNADVVRKALEKCVPKKKSHLIELNVKALEIGAAN